MSYHTITQIKNGSIKHRKRRLNKIFDIQSILKENRKKNFNQNKNKFDVNMQYSKCHMHKFWKTQKFTIVGSIVAGHNFFNFTQIIG